MDRLAAGSIDPTDNVVFDNIAIIDVANQPMIVYLRNDSPATVYYAANTNVKAALMITGVTPAFGCRMTQTSSID